MREIVLNGYIDNVVWWGDEITPDALHEMLYGENNDQSDDVHIKLNSYGGDCNSAVMMSDDLHDYPGSVSITVSGTAASAATVLAAGADHVEMTPGSLWMIHDPSVMAFGNEKDLKDAIAVLRACKESILNVYDRRVQGKTSRDKLAKMMADTTWMDAETALENGFIDGIANAVASGGPTNAITNRADAAKQVQNWLDRRKPDRPNAIKEQETDEATKPVTTATITADEITGGAITADKIAVSSVEIDAEKVVAECSEVPAETADTVCATTEAVDATAEAVDVTDEAVDETPEPEQNNEPKEEPRVNANFAQRLNLLQYQI